MNDVGQSTFLTHLKITGPGEWGVVLNTGSATEVLARHDDPVPGGSGTLRLENAEPTLNSSGQVVFEVPILSGGRGVFLHNGAELVKIVRSGDLTPDGNRHFVSTNQFPLINDLGHVAFHGSVQDANFTSSDGVWLYNGNGLVEVVPWGVNAPDGNGTLYDAGPQDINDLDQIIVSSDLSGTAGGTNDDRGLFLYDGGNLKTLAREGAPVPGGDGEFAALGSWSTIHNSGVAVFSADLRNTSGGTSDNYAIYLSDGNETIEVARKGDLLDGRITKDIHAPTPHRFRRQSNEFGQVLIRALFDDGHGLYVYTPDLHWRAPTSGNWDAKVNWTVSLLPSAPHKVVINPANDVTVTGASIPVTIKSLTIGGGAGYATLMLQPGGTIVSTDGVTVSENGALAGNGAIDADVLNSGLLSPGASTGQITINGKFGQRATGIVEIELGSASAFDHLDVAGAANLGGTLRLSLLGGFLPANGDSFEIFSWGTSVGTFSRMELPELPAGRFWDTSNLMRDGVLAVTPESTTLTGDYNGDGTVNAADYTVWRNTRGKTGRGLGGRRQQEQLGRFRRL